MGNIAEYLRTLRTAVFGKDVRESIAKSIEQTYEDATRSGNANMEVSDARGNYSSLKNRLDTEKNNMQSQIDGLASGSPLVASSTAGMTDTSRIYVNTTDGHWYYYNGTAWTDGGVYQSSGVGNDSIKVNNLSNNLQNSEGIRNLDITWIEGSGYLANNSTISNVNIMKSNVILIKKGETIKIKGVGVNTSIAIIVSCDSEGNNINAILPASTTSAAEYTYTFGVDTYIIITIGKSNFEYAYCYSTNTTQSNLENENCYQNKQNNLIKESDTFGTVSTSYQFSNTENTSYNKILQASINSNGQLKYGYNYNLYKKITLDENTLINKIVVFFDIKNTGESIIPLKLIMLNKSLQSLTGRSSTSSKILDLTNNYKRYIFVFDVNITTDEFNIAFGYDVATESAVTGSYEIRLLGYAINTNINVISNNLYTQSDKVLLNEKLFVKNKNISILGDSYSTYGGWLPDNYSSWYKDTGNTQENDVSDVTQTWWYKLIKDTGNSLLVNCSYSGSTICNTGYSGSDSSATSFITRMKTWLGEHRKTDAKPNMIFIFGGTNDVWAGSPIGELQYSNWTENDLKSVLPAFCYMLDYILKWNPGAKIYFITNTNLGVSLSNNLNTACEHYGVKNIILSNIEKENGHPNQVGMQEIEKQIISQLR